MPALEKSSAAATFWRLVNPVMRLRFLAVPLLVLNLCATARAQVATPPPTLYGEIKGTNYIAPGGRFRIGIPVLPELGGQVHDSENVVTFDDPVSIHVSVACFPFDMTQKWEHETRETRDYLEYFYREFVFPDFEGRFPGSSNEASLFSPQLRDGALFVFTLLPGGSAFEGRSTLLDPTAKPTAIAKRGTLLFVQNGCVYVISSELAERVTQRAAFQKTPEQENEILRARLVELAGRIQIAATKPGSR